MNTDQPNPTPAPSGPVQPTPSLSIRFSPYNPPGPHWTPPTPTPPQPAPDRHEASRAAFEAHYPFGESITEITMKRVLWEAWCHAIDHAAQERSKESEHVCALNMDMLGTCFVCGSVNESIRAARETEESQRQQEQAAPEPQGSDMDYCDDCGYTLTQCGPQDADGEPSLDCKVCTFRAQLAAAQSEAERLRELANSLILAMETVRLDRTWELDGNTWALQTTEWAEWLMEKATEARAALTPNSTEQ